ncbi:hypothetical protein [Anaerobranca gottschalkii]|uniref:Uncharacterized protein n=1 Tax=Anaerobranca gottschalkii DSM 13577 TaxID=1120990 RepID=A0A1I0BCV2_9FIRM|nr:hypothetical protein [Anaerobranca gottschalkii]SET04708.1 hypothetical protein SAMN03080614_10379 [Anaerobranca gottschalkii DSM 13577]
MKSKIISFFKKKKEKEDLYETCLICKTKTHIRKDQPIEERYGYVEGVGQVCYDCYQEIKKQS